MSLKNIKFNKHFELNSKWLSCDNLTMIEVISINKDEILYKDVINNTNMIRSNSHNDFIHNYKKIGLDTTLYKGLPKKYIGSKKKQCSNLI